MATGPRFYAPYFQPVTADGVVVSGALLNFYLTTSNTRTPTYSNIGLTVANSNPVVADDNGLFPNIFLDPSVTYKAVLTGPDDGITPPVEIWTADPVEEAWLPTATTYFDLPFEWLGVPAASSEIMALYTALRPERFFGNFNGTSAGQAQAQGNCITAPADGNVVVHVFVNEVSGSPVGTMTITVTTGAFAFATTSGLPVDLDAGDYLAFVGPASPDSAFANATWSIPGYAL